jgi:hypothetical protein
MGDTFTSPGAAISTGRTAGQHSRGRAVGHGADTDTGGKPYRGKSRSMDDGVRALMRHHGATWYVEPGFVRWFAPDRYIGERVSFCVWEALS